MGLTTGSGYTLSYFHGINDYEYYMTYLTQEIIDNGEVVYSRNPPSDYEYVPFVREGVKWVYCMRESGWDGGPYAYQGVDFTAPGYKYFTLELKGDTIVGGKAYKMMHKYSGSTIDAAHDTVPILLREEDRMVYGLVPSGRIYEDCPIVGNYYKNENWYDGQEHLLYDFNNPVVHREWTEYLLFEDYRDVGSNYINLGDEKAARYECSFNGLCHYLVEGVGMDAPLCSSLSFFYPIKTGAYDCGLSHVIKDGKIIYKGMRYRHGAFDGIDEKVVIDQTLHPIDPHYYDLMGRAVGTEVPTAPGIYIHQGKKIVIR